MLAIKGGFCANAISTKYHVMAQMLVLRIYDSYNAHNNWFENDLVQFPKDPAHAIRNLFHKRPVNA